MARRIPRDESLARVHGVGALFATAYGNVGSSIYYALGVVAAFALGLTPIAFLVAGLIFVFTAATYAEATVMYPEAGGSSSSARLNFVLAIADLLTQVVLVSIGFALVFSPEILVENIDFGVAPTWGDFAL